MIGLVSGHAQAAAVQILLVEQEIPMKFCCVVVGVIAIA